VRGEFKLQKCGHHCAIFGYYYYDDDDNDMKLQNINLGNNLTCSIHFAHRTAATLYNLEILFVAGM
jgi:hypothetical protein